MNSITLTPASHFSGEVQIPGSKSISNRVMLIGALAEGENNFTGMLESDDTRYMHNALEKLGISIGSYFFYHNSPKFLRIKGKRGEFVNKDANLFLGNSGTAMRSLAAALCIGEGEYILRGEPRMHERPIKDLVDALRSLGANIGYLENKGFPPLRIMGHGLNGGQVSIKGNISSQFLSALLIAAPYCKEPLEITVDGNLISKPYVYMTIRLMEKFGIKVENNDYKNFKVEKGIYKAQTFDIEGDASSASYFWAGAAIAQGNVVVKGISHDCLQGDVKFLDVIKEMGSELKGITVDATLFPDAAMTICPLACYAKGKTKITGIASWKVKETDRISAMANELRKVGASVETGDDFIEITPPEHILPATIETYNDHRMAMCFSLLSLNSPHKNGAEITILNPACVNKTFPDYFKLFYSLLQRPIPNKQGSQNLCL
ncbi:MAG: 3-phosphoshikimate 1-carboxyvinyltransferase [Fibromonadaceae bacterium]|jgi:3-phosphoshikimate 1-carboxyvinyltransferase|nr:3-phosphoshikimate 1-carboxyvinyltransferase [Fibromonadaceae bacterium]